MIVEIPDSFTMNRSDFDAMTTGLAKMLMFFCTRERYKIIVENDPESGTVKVTQKDAPS